MINLNIIEHVFKNKNCLEKVNIWEKIDYVVKKSFRG